MKTTVEVIDEASPWLEWAAEAFPNFTRSALKSTGWWLSQEIKKGIRSGAPGGKRYPKRMEAKRRRPLEAKFGGQSKRMYPWLGQLPKAVGYQYQKGDNSVLVGPLSPSAVKLFEKHESGSRSPATRKVRRAYFAAGVGISPSKRTIDLPARPTIGTIYEAYESKITPHVEEKIWSYLTGSKSRSKRTSARKYRVIKRWF